MKKNYLVLILTLFGFIHLFSQSTTYIVAPQYDNSTSGNSGPNGTGNHAYMRGVNLVLQSELTGIPSGSNITSFGFTLNSGTNLTAVNGNFTLYLENTSDVTYQKGTTFATAITGMTNVYASTMTVPNSSGTTSITITLSTPFNYTGGGLYVAYDWTSSGPFDATAAIYRCNSLGLVPGMARGASTTTPPSALTTSAFRPCFLFGVANTYTNDVEVLGVETNGKVTGIFNTPQLVKALIKNSSNTSLSNILVNLNVSGANTANSTLTISSLASGASTLVSFTPYNPTIAGLNTVSVSVNSDQNNLNNSSVFAQSVTCNEWALNPAAGAYTNAVGYNTGSGIIAVNYLNPVNSTLTAIRGAISTNAPSVGNQVYGVLLSSAGAVIATTNTITISNAMLGTFQTFNFTSGQNLSASTSYYLGFAQMIGTVGYFPAGTYTSAYLPANVYATSPLTGGVMTPLTSNLGYFGIEGVFATNIVSASASPTAVCLGASSTLSATGTASSFTWNPGAINSGSLFITPSVTTIYTVSGEIPGLCLTDYTLSVNVIPLPNLNIASNQASICLGNSATLTASGASTYTWDSGANTFSIIQSPSVNTTYSVTGTSAAGCINSATFEVTVNSFTPSITTATNICQGREITLSAGGGTVYNWSTNSPFPNINVSPSLTTVYSVTSTATSGCSGVNSTTVTVNSNPTITASAQRTLMCKGETNTLSVSGASTYTWSTGSNQANTIISPTTNIIFNYSVTGSNSTGCTHTAQVSVKVENCTGISQNDQENLQVSIFPNPGNGFYTLKMHETNLPESLRILSINGQLLMEITEINSEMKLNLSEFSNGIYLIHFIDKYSESKVLKLIKE